MLFDSLSSLSTSAARVVFLSQIFSVTACGLMKLKAFKNRSNFSFSDDYGVVRGFREGCGKTQMRK